MASLSSGRYAVRHGVRDQGMDGRDADGKQDALLSVSPRIISHSPCFLLERFVVEHLRFGRGPRLLSFGAVVSGFVTSLYVIYIYILEANLCLFNNNKEDK